MIASTISMSETPDDLLVGLAATGDADVRVIPPPLSGRANAVVCTVVADGTASKLVSVSCAYSIARGSANAVVHTRATAWTVLLPRAPVSLDWNCTRMQSGVEDCNKIICQYRMSKMAVCVFNRSASWTVRALLYADSWPYSGNARCPTRKHSSRV
jgi:hypothetical protein